MRDSNPRYRFYPYNALAGRPLRPLGQLSVLTARVGPKGRHAAILPRSRAGATAGRGMPHNRRDLLEAAMRVQVGIIGGGPAGLLLSQLLHRAGSTTSCSRRAAAPTCWRASAPACSNGARSRCCAAPASASAWTARATCTTAPASPGAAASRFFIDTRKYAGKPMMAYGQTNITEDLYAARDAMGGVVIDEAEDVTPHDVDGTRRTSPTARTARRSASTATSSPAATAFTA